jgi:hypothetical protein
MDQGGTGNVGSIQLVFEQQTPRPRLGSTKPENRGSRESRPLPLTAETRVRSPSATRGASGREPINGRGARRGVRRIRRTARSRQCRALNLKPWETPPCHVNDPDNPVREERKAARLQQRMLRAGVSKWHPDPLAAIAEAKQQSAGRRS